MNINFYFIKKKINKKYFNKIVNYKDCELIKIKIC